MTQPKPPQKKSVQDLIVIGMISIAAFILAGAVDAFEWFFEFSRSHDDWELDEIAMVLIIAAFALTVFSWRRWHELGQELIYRQWVESELNMAKQRAEIANHAKSEFLASMSHELRTPLNGILGYTQILQRDKTLTHQQHDAIQTMQKSGEHLLTLINDILDLSKIEANKMDLNTETFQLPNFLESIVNMIQIRAHQQKIEFNYEFSADLPYAVNGDEVRLRQVLVNLLGNAIKFTQQGQVNFYVNCQQNEITFTIQDTGVGIAAAHLKTIFEPFKQAGHNAFTEGSGLGLPISQRFVKMMGGEIHVDSTEGKGSCFAFSLQLPEIADWQPEQSQQREIIGFQGDACKILLVDDKVSNRMVLFSLLSPLGFEIKQCDNGLQSIEMAQDFIPDLIIMDLVMPVMDGLTAMREIRNNPTLESTIIIGASASAFDQDRIDCFSAGCDDFITKPIQVDELLDKIGTYLELEWQYDETGISDVSEVQQTINAPPIDLIHVLHQNITNGDIEEVSEQAAQLMLQPEYQAFAQQLQQLADEFDLDQLQAFIEPYLQ
ncbi:ATP-binding protein [Candidatus Albibeggiatoa sp. nov. NOAA]|uniref:ATP-binding protein n=1 Tax=Candidatus Albibeggiatoa sp. nov. NOAA TaxID=3162724 RepID=UPI0032FDE6B8|nr:ATP-binding protein [Thiotrichaceae bacterium]